MGVEVMTVFVDTPVDVAWKRLQENRKTNLRFDVTDEDFNSTVAEMEPPGDQEKHLVFEFNTNLDDWLIENHKRMQKG
jgi:hypothetical protein